MPILAKECLACGNVYDALTTTMEGAEDAKRCPNCCSTNIKSLIATSIRVEMVDSKNMSEGEVQMHLDHKRDLERGIAEGRMEVTMKGPREFWPQVERRLY